MGQSPLPSNRALSLRFWILIRVIRGCSYFPGIGSDPCNAPAKLKRFAFASHSRYKRLRMGLAEEPEAWLEREGQEHILQGNCSIGRAALNTIVLESAKVSRLHSIIHSERAGAFWLVDLGSSNGTFLNKRRIHEPVRLRDRDQITVGGNSLIFRQARNASDRP